MFSDDYMEELSVKIAVQKYVAVSEDNENLQQKLNYLVEKKDQFSQVSKFHESLDDEKIGVFGIIHDNNLSTWLKTQQLFPKSNDLRQIETILNKICARPLIKLLQQILNKLENQVDNYENLASKFQKVVDHLGDCKWKEAEDYY